jgi:hypothetical protein
VFGRGVADDVGEVDGCDHAEMKSRDRGGKVDAAGELVGCGPSGGLGGGGRDRGSAFAGSADQRRAVRLAGLVSSPQRLAKRLRATWSASSAGASRWRTPLSIWPFLAAASVRMLVVLVMSACTRATRT